MKWRSYTCRVCQWREGQRRRRVPEIVYGKGGRDDVGGMYLTSYMAVAEGTRGEASRCTRYRLPTRPHCVTLTYTRLLRGDWRLLRRDWRLLRGDRRLLRGDWKLLREDWRLLRGDWRLLRGDWRSLWGDWRLLRGDCRLLLGDLEVTAW